MHNGFCNKLIQKHCAVALDAECRPSFNSMCSLTSKKKRGVTPIKKEDLIAAEIFI